MFNEPETTKLEEIGEFGLIKQLTQNIELKNNTIKGVGDDAAVLNPTAGKITLVSTDLLLEGVHFDLSYFPLKHLGYKAVVVNLSDICAMNAKPTQITVSVAECGEANAYYAPDDRSITICTEYAPEMLRLYKLSRSQ